MKKLLLSVCAFSLTLATLQAGEITKYVNPFIGTGAIDGGLSGNNYPGATSPYSFLRTPVKLPIGGTLPATTITGIRSSVSAIPA